MSPVSWYWNEKDFGFRFRSGSGRKMAEHYQATQPDEFYVVPSGQRKLKKDRIDELASTATLPTSPMVVPNPWQNYHRDWDWIQTAAGICLNFAGCLDREEIDRREDRGIQRAIEFIERLLLLPEPASLTVDLIRQLHREMMSEVYPFAGEWRTVDLHKGEGPIKWPFPPGGIQPQMDVFERDVLSRSPFLSDDEEEVYAYVSEVMNEILSIHPFREGNGRLAFMVGNLLLMQNGLPPLKVYNRRRDEQRYLSSAITLHARLVVFGRTTSRLQPSSPSGRRRNGANGRITMAKRRRLDIKAILADPDLRRRLMVDTLRVTQAREGIETTEEQAERAYYIVTEAEKTAFFDLERFRASKDKPERRHAMFVHALRGAPDRVRFDVARRDFSAIDGLPLAYRRVGLMAHIFRDAPALEPAWGIARQGKATGDDSRWVRQSWEIVPDHGWSPFAKGGDYCRFYADIDLVLDWKPEHREALQASGNGLPSLELYFKPGLTWPRRTQRGFNLRVMPAGCIFADKGPAIFPAKEGNTYYLLGIANSTLSEYLLRGLTSFGSWEVGVVQRLPILSPTTKQRDEIGGIAKLIHDAKASWDESNELCSRFIKPWLLREAIIEPRSSLTNCLDRLTEAEAAEDARIQKLYTELNNEVYGLYGIPESLRGVIEETLGERPPELIWPQMEGKTVEQKRMEHIWRLLSYVVRRVVEADEDGIVPLMAIPDEMTLLERVHQELAGLFLDRDVNQVEVEIINELRHRVKGYNRTNSIREWLEDEFFHYHVALYKNRPIIWHISSKPDRGEAAFAALIQYHKFDRNRMAKLRSSYLREALNVFRREAGLASQEGRANDRLEWQSKIEETEALDQRLQWVQEGQHEGIEGSNRDFRILTPWKSTEERPKGWDPDLDDGVKVNIKPLQRAGVLRRNDMVR